MPIPKKSRIYRAVSDVAPDAMHYLDLLAGWTPGWVGQSRLHTKLARARARDEPVLYTHLLPGIDLLLCSIPGARAPYPSLSELTQRCIDSVTHALEQRLDGLRNSGYWYEFNGLAVLVFASMSRKRVLAEFGAGKIVS